MSRTCHHGGYNPTRQPWVKRPSWAWMNTPGWWIREYMNQPKRAANHRLERAVLNGQTDPDAIAWPLGNRKPHVYYW